MPSEDFSLTTAQVRAAQSGDREALEQLFARYLPRVSRIVAARTGRGWREFALHDDIVQETFVDAFAAIQSGQIVSEGAFCSWLARCVQNNLQDELRRGRADKRGGIQLEDRVETRSALHRAVLVQQLSEVDPAGSHPL